MKVGAGADLSRGMQWGMTTHVRRYHRHYRSSGHLWQGRYKSFDVQEDDHFLTVARYVEGNPVRAGLVNTATDWVWSSHRERCGIEKASLLSPFPVPAPIGEKWTEFVDTPLTLAEQATVRKRIERQTGGLAPPGACPL